MEKNIKSIQNIIKNKDMLKNIYHTMKRIRLVEERIAFEYPKNEIRCPTHLSIGQEAVPTALSILLRNRDLAVSTHRGHAHYLSKGGSLKKMIAELYGKSTGCSGGKGGSMHLIDKAAGFMGTSAIVGNSIPIGVGLGLSIKLRKEPFLACIYLGDGAAEEGSFYESLNFSVLKNLPVLFICENNLYSVYSPLSKRQPKGRKIYSLAQAIGANTAHCDGNNVFEAINSLKKIIEEIRTGDKKTWFIEFDTYRWREHCGYQFDNDIGYRTEDEFEKWKSKDPLKLVENFSSNVIDIKKIEDIINLEINEAFQEAKKAPFPKSEEAFRPIFAK